MKVLHVNVFDVYGGGETIMRRLCDGLIKSGHEAGCLVRQKNRAEHAYPVEVFQHDAKRPRWSRLCVNVGTRLMEGPGKERMWVRGVSRFLINQLGQPLRTWKRQAGREDFDFPDTEAAMHRFSFEPDLIHIHCFHGQYFDLRKLTSISQWKPTVVTLHDPWMFTGHCAYPGDCEGFKTGCGSCPDLKRYPAIPRDATAENFQRKKNIYVDSNIHVAAPSRWMMDQLEASALGHCFLDKIVIPNGIDTAAYTPGDVEGARKVWRLPDGVPVLLYVARNARNSPYKDYATIERAARQVATERGSEVHLLVLGEEAEKEVHGHLNIHFALTTDHAEIMAAYRAADIYLHAAAAENFPTTVLEAMACGVPVVATKIGGIPEQVDDGKTGYLVEPGDDSEMAQKIQRILSDTDLRGNLGEAGRARVVEKYDQSVMTNVYLKWYEKICASC
jgi:glycosyltransferase involved in cell wall biosynthesis